MKYSFALVAASAAIASAQGVGNISPAGGSPAGCVSTSSQTYELTVVKIAGAQKRELSERDDGTPLMLHLNNGILTDAKGRIGSIVANRQFQFDGPPAQTGAVYTAGWSICPNSSLAIGPNTAFYQCLSGEFYNLYDQSVGAQCSQVQLNVIPVGANTGAGVSQQADGQPTGAVGQQSDGQPTGPSATTYVPVTQISDGQIQATQPAVTQIGDGQIQAPTGGNVTVSSTPTQSIQVGGASSMVASGAVVALGAAAMLFL